MREQMLDLLRRHMHGGFRPSGGNNVLTKCPFHKGGQETKPSFSINVVLGLFHCFTCHESGDVEKLLRMLSVPQNAIDRELAVIKPLLQKGKEEFLYNKKYVFANNDPFRADYILPETVMGVYGFSPQGLVDDGFDPALMARLGVGYDRNKDRVMYPLRDMYGNLAGFSGGATIQGQSPKYLVYQGKRKGFDGKWKKGDFGDWFDDMFPDYQCENHDFLWNFHTVWPRVVHQQDPVIYLVEGFKAAMWMIQNGFENTVALMGSYISTRQQQMFHRLGCTVVLFLDNDAPGRKATINVGDLLWWPMYGRVKVIPYPEEDSDLDTQPDDYDESSVRYLVSQAMDFRQFYNKKKREQSWH